MRSTQQPLDATHDMAEADLTTLEAAQRLGVSERTIRRAIVRGDIPARKQGGAYRIAAKVLERIAPPRPSPRLVTLIPPRDGKAPLPRPLTPFIGRRDDLAAVIALLQDGTVRLLTLIGPGGIGKTRLAIEAASAVEGSFADGAVFVSLGAIAREVHVLPAIATALGLKESVRHDLRQRVRAFLLPRRLLLLIDNIEHLPRAAPLVGQLMMDAPGLTVLLTGRAPLHISGEHEFPVPALGLPTPDHPLTADAVVASDGGLLFVERARAIDPNFSLDESSATAVAEICARLDGLPLAIELAAAHAKLLPPRMLLERLAPALAFLTGGPRDAPRRQRTLRDTIAWSYDLLSPEDQAFFRRLAVFAGGFTIEAAEYKGGDKQFTPLSAEAAQRPSPPFPPAPPSTLDRLAALLDQSLLLREIGLQGEPRFRMLATLRDFGVEQLAALDEEVSARAAHAQYFLHFAQSLRVPALLNVAAEPLSRLEAEHANLHAALTWLDEAGPDEAFVRLAAALCGYWNALSRFREWREWLERALAKSDAAQALDRARVLIGLGRLNRQQGELATSEVSFDSGLPLLRELADPLEASATLVWRSSLAKDRGDHALAERLVAEALALAETADEPRWSAAAAGNALANLGRWQRRRGAFAHAAYQLEAVLQCFQQQGLERGVTRSLHDLGDLARDQGNTPLAATRYSQVLARAGEEGDLVLMTEALEGVAGAAAGLGHFRHAARLYGATDALRERAGTAFLHPEDIVARQRGFAQVRQAFGEERVAALQKEGGALSPASIKADVAAVVSALGEPAVQSAGRGDRTALTEREREVLRLLVARRTDREIANVLFLSQHTVHWHVSRILGKLGVNSRRQAAALAMADGLV